MALPKDRPIATTAERSRRDRAVRLTLLASALLFGYLTVIATVSYSIGVLLILITLWCCLTVDAHSELKWMDYMHIGVTTVTVTVVWITMVLRGI